MTAKAQTLILGLFQIIVIAGVFVGAAIGNPGIAVIVFFISIIVLFAFIMVAEEELRN